MESIRRSRMAGSWYPGQQVELNKLLIRFSSMVPPSPHALTADTRLAALIAPHAGYRFSGPTAAFAYATLAGWRPPRVVVIAPSHQEWFPGVCAWSPVDGAAAPGVWRTPLGDVPLDLSFLQKLGAAWPELRFGCDGHREEHSLELQLPFLQHALGSFKLVPLAMGDQSTDLVLILSRILAQLLDDVPTLLVASTDLSHFHTENEAKVLDKRFLSLLRQGQTRPLMEGLRGKTCEACGGGPVAAALECCNLSMRRPVVHVLDQCTSARVTGETGSVVGYGAALICEAVDA